MKTSKAIRDLLERKGVLPTGNAIKDMELAKKVMKPLHDKLTEKYCEQSK